MPSENGWEPARVSASACVWTDIPGTDASMLLLAEIAVLAAAFAADYNAYVEPLYDADCASYTPVNSVPTSNHLNATAWDMRWNTHPFKVKGTFTAAQVAEIRRLQAFYTIDDLLLIFWAGDWRSPVDEMHWQMGYGTYDRRDLIKRFVAERVRDDGFSTYRRGGTPRGGGAAVPPAASGGLTPAVLAQVMDNRVPMPRYEALLPAMVRAMNAGQISTVLRRAMFCAQVGHESGGLKYQTELADGSAYEGRTDLGNTQPGDGRRFRGRDFLQITGRNNYTRLSQWAHSQGIVPTPTYFVDRPDDLASDQYAFVGAVWYWTVARPQLNTLADNGDILGATRAVNGGTNGLNDRKAFYQRALAAGTALLDPAQYDEWEALMADGTFDQSRSIYRTDNNRVFTARDMVYNADAMGHAQLVETAAIRGEGWAVELVARTANGTSAGAKLWWDATKDDVWAINHARHLLQMIEIANPAALQSYLGKA